MENTFESMFAGLGMKPLLEQPQVNDPVTGKPLNMNDPELPIIRDPDAKFTQVYWRMADTDYAKLTYLREHWEYYNKKLFEGKLRPLDQIRLLRDVAVISMRKEGHFGRKRVEGELKRELAVSPNLFNAPHEGWVNNLIVHEMCHQSTHEQYPEDFAVQDAHGWRWQREMLRCGLQPTVVGTWHPLTMADNAEKKTLSIDLSSKFATKSVRRWWVKFEKTDIKPDLVVGFHLAEKIYIGRVLGKDPPKTGHWIVVVQYAAPTGAGMPALATKQYVVDGSKMYDPNQTRKEEQKAERRAIRQYKKENQYGA